MKKGVFYALFLLVSILYVPVLNFPSTTPRFIVMALISPLLLYFSRREKLNFTPLSWLISLLFLWKLSSYFGAVSKIAYIQSSLFLLFAFVSYFALKSFLKVTHHFDVVLLLSVSSLIISLVGIFQYFGIASGIFSQRAAPAAMFVNKNFASPYIVYSFWWIFLYFLKTKNRILLPLLSINLFYLLISATRSSWIAFIAVFILFIIIGILRLRHLSCQFLFGISIIFIIFILLVGTTKFKPKSVKVHRDFYAQIDSVFSVNNSVKVRLLKWQNSMAIIKDYPFAGVGNGNFGVVYPLYHKAVTDDIFYSSHYFEGGAHNEYIQLICENGLVALFLFLGILFVFFKNLILGIKSHRFLVLSIILSSVSLLIVAFFSSILHQPTYIFLALLNLAFADVFLQKKEVFYPNIIKYATLICFIFFVFISYKIYNGDRYFKKSNIAFYNANYKDAWKYGQKSVKIWKYQPQALFNTTNYGYTYFIYHHDIYGKLNVIADTAISALPYHFMPNFAKGLLLTKSKNKILINEYLKRKEILINITPKNKEQDMKKVINSLEKKYDKS